MNYRMEIGTKGHAVIYEHSWYSRFFPDQNYVASAYDSTQYADLANRFEEHLKAANTPDIFGVDAILKYLRENASDRTA